MGELNKQTFKYFVDFECERQLLLKVGEDDPRWISPLRKLVPMPPGPRPGIAELGKVYESNVYASLRHSIHDVLCKENMAGVVIPTDARARHFRKIAEAMQAEGPEAIRCLIEYQWQTPEAFARQIFGLYAEDEIPLTKPTGKLRPDLFRLTHLSDEALMGLLRSTIYSVEKFQGSDRDYIIASVGISSRDQLSAEEAFIYDLNRFNVLTSRAKQKMLLVCSRNFLDYVPRDRDVLAYAARIRDYAMNFCNEPLTRSVERAR